MFMRMAGATVWIKCIGTIASQINQTFTVTQITVTPLQMFQFSHRHDDGNGDWCDWVSDQVLSLSSFGFLAIQGHFSVFILVLDIVRLIIADPHFLHSLCTLQASFLFGWSSSTERKGLVWSQIHLRCLYYGIRKIERAGRTVYTSLDVSLVAWAGSSSSTAFLFLPTVTAGKQKEVECLLLTSLQHQTSHNHWNISEKTQRKYSVYSTGFASLTMHYGDFLNIVYIAVYINIY